MKKTICLAVLAVLFLFANSCHDEVGVDSKLTLKSGKLKKDVVTEMKLWFDSNPDVNKFVLLEYADEVKWASAQVMEIDNSIVMEVQVKLKGKYIVMSQKDPTLNFEHRLLFIQKAGEIASYMEYFISKKDLSYLQDTEKVSYLTRDGSFEGSIVLENSKNELSTIYHSTGNSQELRLKNAPVTCYELIEIFSDGSYKVIANWGCNGDSGAGSTPSGTAGSSSPSTDPAPVPVPNIDIDGYGNLNDAEKELIKTYPMQAIKIGENKQKAEDMTISLFGYNGLNDCSDAFRHAYFQALNTISIGSLLTQDFSDAHESDTPIHLILEKQMDLHNNSVGINIGINCYGFDLSEKIMETLTSGTLYFLSPINQSDPNFSQTHGITNLTRLVPTSNCN